MIFVIVRISGRIYPNKVVGAATTSGTIKIGGVFNPSFMKIENLYVTKNQDTYQRHTSLEWAVALFHGVCENLHCLEYLENNVQLVSLKEKRTILKHTFTGEFLIRVPK